MYILSYSGAQVKRNADRSEASDTNNNPYVEVLRGRDGRDGEDGVDGQDGRDGRDGVPGSSGSAGRDGKDGEKGHKGEKGDPGPPGPPDPSSGGVVYTRWGRTTCPDTPGTELIYAGRAGGSWYNHKGGGANYLCLPESPDYLDYTAGVQGANPIYGAEYQGTGTIASVTDHNVPCSVCSTTARVMVLMLPAKTQCPPSWTLEYNGYLMAGRRNYHRQAFECIDKDPECIPGSAGDENGALFYPTEATCNGLPCPPYDPQKELTCAVCTK